MMPSSVAPINNKIIWAQVAVRDDQILLQRQLPFDDYQFVRESVQRGLGLGGAGLKIYR